MVRCFALALGFVICFSTGANAARARTAQYIIHYETQAEALNVKAILAGSEYKVLRESPDLKAMLVQGPVGIERVRALAMTLRVERSGKVSTAKGKSCARAITKT